MNEEGMFMGGSGSEVALGPNVMRNPADLQKISRIITCSSRLCHRVIVEYGPGEVSKHRQGLGFEVLNAVGILPERPIREFVPCNHHGGEVYGGEV